MVVTVDKSVPMPSARFVKYPFEDMEIGDSFLIPCNTGREYRSVHNTANQRGYKVKTRREGNHFRVWLSDRIGDKA